MLGISQNVSHRLNSNNQKNISFSSSFVPTKYLEYGFNAAMTNKYSGPKFLNSIKAFMNDGLNDVIKIDKTPGSIMRLGRAATHDISVNGKKVVDADFKFGLVFDGDQCVNAINDFAKKTRCVKNVSYKSFGDVVKELRILKSQIFKNG